MALLRQCLQELRTKHHDWDAPAGDWPEPKPVQQARLGCSLQMQGDRRPGRRAIVRHRMPTA
ncbi:hypothetical protein [Piscinibacter sp. XHJ-5]|uniref:hypothetical protein n=1 Tax=Piscinibacter sp. XHJ-5 TaxID=3037797 RepID=UPI0024534F07|nr:hypothetical protein [Piscinibacter sp. XHJ-5]